MTDSENGDLVASGYIIVGLRRGVCATAGRRLRDVLQGFTCAATLENEAGAIARVHVLLDTLLLEVSTGERIRLRCQGPEAPAAFRALASVLEGREEVENA